MKGLIPMTQKDYEDFEKEYKKLSEEIAEAGEKIKAEMKEFEERYEKVRILVAAATDTFKDDDAVEKKQKEFVDFYRKTQKELEEAIEKMEQAVKNAKK